MNPVLGGHLLAESNDIIEDHGSRYLPRGRLAKGRQNGSDLERPGYTTW
jgi:hypothetical protein